ncbi:MAG: hypothetical protein ACE5GM_07060 [bacterium]
MLRPQILVFLLSLIMISPVKAAAARGGFIELARRKVVVVKPHPKRKVIPRRKIAPLRRVAPPPARDIVVDLPPGSEVDPSTGKIVVIKPLPPDRGRHPKRRRKIRRRRLLKRLPERKVILRPRPRRRR